MRKGMREGDRTSHGPVFGLADMLTFRSKANMRMGLREGGVGMGATGPSSGRACGWPGSPLPGLAGDVVKRRGSRSLRRGAEGSGGDAESYLGGTVPHSGHEVVGVARPRQS